MTRRRFLSAKRELILLGAKYTEENRVISGCLQSHTTGFNLLEKKCVSESLLVTTETKNRSGKKKP